ncbi:hypothetical protein [Rudaea sp.]|uniref:hypothetical protein n=1 Tax=Rudaea sp. TaxID=2136325 RepID=UPI00321F86E9
MFARAPDARSQRIAQTLALGFASLAVARLGRPGLAKQPVRSLLLTAFALARDAVTRAIPALALRAIRFANVRARSRRAQSTHRANARARLRLAGCC